MKIKNKYLLYTGIFYNIKCVRKMLFCGRYRKNNIILWLLSNNKHIKMRCRVLFAVFMGYTNGFI